MGARSAQRSAAADQAQATRLRLLQRMNPPLPKLTLPKLT